MHNKDLSLNSKTQYTTKIQQFVKLVGAKNVVSLLLAPDKAMNRLRKADISHTPSNHHVYLAAACSIMKHVKGLRDSLPTKAVKRWSELRQSNTHPITERYHDNQPTERQRQAIIPLADVISARDALPVGNMVKLLLMMYTGIPPARGGDYHSVKIYRNRTRPPAKDDGNYLLLPDSNACKLVLQQFKTAKQYHSITHELPQEVCSEIRASLRVQPRTHLFASPETGLPYTRSAFSAWAVRALKKLFGKPVTLTMLRHLYISSLDFNRMTLRQMEHIGNQMGHSVAMQTLYRWPSTTTK